MLININLSISKGHKLIGRLLLILGSKIIKFGVGENLNTMTDKVSDNWYKDFFQGINCELWEKAIPPDVTKQVADFF